MLFILSEKAMVERKENLLDTLALKMAMALTGQKLALKRMLSLVMKA